MKIRKWRRVSDPRTGISLEVGRLKYSEKPALAAMVADVFGSIGDLPANEEALRRVLASDRSAAVSMAKAASAMVQKIDPDLVERLFEHRVRNVEAVETEDGPVTTGLDLLEVTDHKVILWVLTELLEGSSLREAEGKASGSPSTSPVEATGASGSPAEPTPDADGPSPSTAPETQPDRESSSQAV